MLVVSIVFKLFHEQVKKYTYDNIFKKEPINYFYDFVADYFFS